MAGNDANFSDGSEISRFLSLRHDYPFKLGFRGTRDRDCRRCEGVPGELTPVFATPGPVTTLLRDTQVHEFGTVFRFPVDADRRSDTFTSQTVTTLFCSTIGDTLNLIETVQLVQTILSEAFPTTSFAISVTENGDGSYATPSMPTIE
ncbi:hypothetical protein [Burkholderia cepacia]|uniref:hypothetical protein n=1 Tax=Burkholderia cepacia TaxID=292 RepID=UPI002AB7E68A|nr:hypothetical protein [Burkholderia cepacia]